MTNHGRERIQRFMDRRRLLKSAAGMVSIGEIMREGSLAGQSEDNVILEGYTDLLSYRAGEKLGLCVSTSLPHFSIEITRVGAQRETVFRKDKIAGSLCEVPDDASTHGCNWPISTQVTVSPEWRSGYYEIKLRGAVSSQAPVEQDAFFVVRPKAPGKGSSILLQLATNTYNAYNNWGGSCLYQGGALPMMGKRVSFQRPMARGHLSSPDGELSRWAPYAGWHHWEREFVSWVEGQGCPVEFAVNSDLEQHPELLQHYQLILSVGHDEYWSAGMRDNLETYISNGGNVAFFSGNVAYWQVRSEDRGQALVCYKYDYKNDPHFHLANRDKLATLWSNRLVNRPENQLTGVSFNYGGYHRFGSVPRGGGGYTIHRPEHWVFEGTDLQWGDLLGAKEKIVGYECDGCEYRIEQGNPVPTGRDGTPASFVILAKAPAALWETDLEFAAESLFGKTDEDSQNRVRHGAAVMGVYTRGGTVFTTGCTEWSHGLAHKNPLVEQITRNVLRKLSRENI